MEIKFQHLIKGQCNPDEFNDVLDLAREDLGAELHKVKAITVCSDGHGNEAFAACSGKDQFSKKRGRMISEGRLIKLLQENERIVYA